MLYQTAVKGSSEPDRDHSGWRTRAQFPVKVPGPPVDGIHRSGAPRVCRAKQRWRLAQTVTACKWYAHRGKRMLILIILILLLFGGGFFGYNRYGARGGLGIGGILLLILLLWLLFGGGLANLRL